MDRRWWGGRGLCGGGPAVGASACVPERSGSRRRAAAPAARPVRPERDPAAGPPPRCQCSPDLVATLARWVADGAARLAVGVVDGTRGPTLISHAGLTRGFWDRIGGPRDAAEAAGGLDRLLTGAAHLAFQAGPGMLAGAGTEPDVAWAEAGGLYRSWMVAARRGERVAFSQIHGHSSVFPWFHGRWRPSTAPAASADARLDRRSRHVEVRIGGRSFVGIDPGFGGRAPHRPIVPLVCGGEVLASPARPPATDAHTGRAWAGPVLRVGLTV